MFGGNIAGPNSDSSLYDFALRFAPDAGIGAIHDLYATNSSQYNSLQKLNSEKARLEIPFMQYGECLHGVGSFKQSMFPQSIGLAASFDTDVVHRVGMAIGAEARSIGIHACLSPVLDLGLDPRWGRGMSPDIQSRSHITKMRIVQEAWGEDMLLTSHMGVAMASGLSRNGSWDRPDAVAPVVKRKLANLTAVKTSNILQISQLMGVPKEELTAHHLWFWEHASSCSICFDRSRLLWTWVVPEGL